MSLHNQDEVTNTLTLLHKAGFRSAIVAGGAVRDAYFGIKPRDIDIYVWHPDFSLRNERTETLTELSLSKILQLDFSKDTITDVSTDSYYGEEIVEIFDVVKNGILYQIISVERRPKDFVDMYFDIGLCKATYDGERVNYFPEFLADASNKHLTVVSDQLDQQQFDYTMNVHMPKMQQKFPTYKVQIAPWNKTFAEAAKEPAAPIVAEWPRKSIC